MLTAPKPGSGQWKQQWLKAWQDRNPGKSLDAPPASPAPPRSAQDAVDGANGSYQASQPLPWDSVAQGQVDAANQTYKVSGGSLDAQQGALGIDYGVKYGTNIDPATGLPQVDPASLTLDYSNPYSKASLLKKAYEQGQSANTGSAASRGQLYSGYLQTKQDQGAQGFNQGNSDLLKGFGSQSLGIYGQRYAAWRAQQDAPLNAQSDAIGRHSGDPVAPPNGAQILANLGGTLVIQGNRRGIRKPDGTIEWLKG